MSTQPQSYQLSYWESEVFFKDIDVLIIGSGIVGLSTALSLKEAARSLKVVILERGPLPIGASTRNAGFACFGSMTELLDDLQTRSENEVWTLVQKRWQGLLRLRQRIGDDVLQYTEAGGFELFRPGEEEVFAQCLEQRQQFNQQLKQITGHPEVYRMGDNRINDFGFRGVAHLMENQIEGVLHTGKMMQALLKLVQQWDIKVINGVGVLNMREETRGMQVDTDNGWRINARHLVVATNGFAATLLPELAVNPARNQVLVTEPITDPPFRGGFHYDRGYVYFREIDGRILLGGGRNLDPEGETTTELGQTQQIKEYLESLLSEVILPGRKVRIDQVWSGIMGVGTVKSPIVQNISSKVTVAVRLGGMGVAIGSLVGEEAARLALEAR